MQAGLFEESNNCLNKIMCPIYMAAAIHGHWYFFVAIIMYIIIMSKLYANIASLSHRLSITKVLTHPLLGVFKNNQNYPISIYLPLLLVWLDSFQRCLVRQHIDEWEPFHSEHYTLWNWSVLQQRLCPHEEYQWGDNWICYADHAIIGWISRHASSISIPVVSVLL